jgi:diadenosine tetraphosphate (Ap4A) HIT family hydrolase
MKQPGCVFCNIEENKVLLKNELAFVIKDKYPHSKGHVLIIPYNHIENYFDLSKEDQNALNDLMNEAKRYCYENFEPSGYNVSVNAGKSAGQIVMHAHVHLIPRY